MAYVSNLGDPKAHGSLALWSDGPSKLLATSHDANMLLSFLQNPFLLQVVQAIWCAIGNAYGF